MLERNELTTWLQKLADADPVERRCAAEALAAGDERAVYPLIRALRDENPGVQDAAMRSIIAIGGEATAYMALPLLRENPFLRNTARIILHHIGRPSVPLLRPLLADKDDDIRTFALDLVGDIGWCEYQSDIARLLKTDPNQNVRASAAKALGTLGDRGALPSLIAALTDSEWVSFSALEALSLLKDESCESAVRELLSGPSEALRYAAIETLGRIGSPRSSPALVDRLPHAGNGEKSAIVKSLVQIGLTPSMAEVGDLLIEMFTRGDWEERLIALRGLADLADRRAIPVILDIAGSLDPSDPENEERLILARQALEKFGCVPALTAVLADPAIKFRGKVLAIEVIGDLQCTEAVPGLIAQMEGDLREVRRASILALSGIGGEQALRELRLRINDRDGHVRRCAIAALGRTGDRESFSAILSHLDVENYRDVLEETVQALLRIDAAALYTQRGALAPAVRETMARFASGIDMLITLSRDTDPAVRVAALSGLGRFEDEQSTARMTEALRDENPEARKIAIAALGARRCCLDDLRTALGDADPWVRLTAVRAFGESGSPEAGKALIPLLYDREAPVVLATIETLERLGAGEAVRLAALQNHPDAAVRERVAEVVERLC